MGLKEGYKSTKYFHCLVNYRRNVNYVEELFIEDLGIEGNNEMREGACSHFQNLFTEEFCWRPKLSNLQFDKLNNFANAQLEAVFTGKEVFDCLRESDSDKAPGTDGLLKFWGTVRDDIMDFFTDFHKNS